MPKNRSGSNLISFVVAILAVGLFFGWLVTREPPRAVAVAEPGDTANAPAPIDESQARLLDADAMANTAQLDALQGEAVRMMGVNVAARLGTQMFWAELPAGDVYLVKLADDLVSGGMESPTSGRYDIVGRIQPKDESTLDRWMESGALQTENHRMQAELGATYLEAQRVQPAAN
jgi:hypothetical protein